MASIAGRNHSNVERKPMANSHSLKDLPKLIGLVGSYVLLAALVMVLFSDNEVMDFLWLGCGVTLVATLVGGNRYTR